nr:tryptophan N-monooxygenase CYP79A68-like [Ziziphus jujuba var. spinosa]
MAIDMEETLNITAAAAASNPILFLFLLPPQKWYSIEYSSTSQKLIPFAIFFVSLVIFLVKTNFINIFTKTKRVPSLPPGPSPWPLVGSVPEMLRNRPAYRWIHHFMKKLDTDIACFRLGKTNVIAVNSLEVTREFLKKHDAVFASRPITINTDIFSHGFLTTGVMPWGDQWKKMRSVLIHDVFNHSKTQWLLEKRNEEADNLVRYLYNLCSDGGSEGKVVNVRTAAQHYSGSVMRRMMFNQRFYGKGNQDGGPGVEEQEHVSALYTMLLYLYAFSVADYLPWLRVFDLGEHEKKVKEAMEVLKKYQEVIVNERVQQWREGRRKEAEDLLDVFITLKDENGNPVLSDEEIKAQITEILLATVDNPAKGILWFLSCCWIIHYLLEQVIIFPLPCLV